jgi:hypothetical protein
MKLRASYGTLGNDQILIMDMSQLGEGTYVLITPSNWYCYRSNSKSKFKWEQAQKTDRLDLKLFNNKVSIVTDYFTDTRDLLIRYSCFRNWCYAPGGALPTANAGTVKNSGVEFSIDYKINFV